MAAPRTSLLARCAVHSLDLAIRYWPENSRRWGQAVLAELAEVTEPTAALSWAAGGILLFFRALFADFLEWLRLPAGRRHSDTPLSSGGEGPQFPKHSRLATAVILLGTVTLLFLPIGREATTTVKASWRGFRASAGDRRDLETIAAQAEKEKDARELAFVALTYPDSDRASQFADRAVALDPSLAWIYGGRYGPPLNWVKSPERLQRLRNSDPDNAFVYFVSAYAEGEPRMAELHAQRGASADVLRNTLASDAEWVKDMDQAFRAPTYDSYFQRHQVLACEAWKKNPNLSPGLIAESLWTHRLPDFLQLWTYVDLRVSEALQAGSPENVKAVEATLGGVTGLGRRMTADGSTFFEREAGFGMTQRGLLGFEKLYRASGRVNEAKGIEAQLREAQTNQDARIQSYLAWRLDVTRAFRSKAIVLQASAILALLLAIIIAISLLVLEVNPASRSKGFGVWRWIGCRAADYGPGLFLAASLAFLASFRPIAELFQQYRFRELTGQESSGLFWQLYVLGDLNPLTYFYEPYHQWLLVTTALVAIAMGVLVQGLLRRRAVPGRRVPG